MTVTANNPDKLPAGISGIAQLEECEILDRDGTTIFRAVGYVLEPEEHRGKYTIKIEPLEGGIRTIEEHWRKILHEIRKLGGNTDIPLEEIHKLLHSLRWAAPKFHFRTWKVAGWKDDIIFHLWDGLVSDNQGG